MVNLVQWCREVYRFRYLLTILVEKQIKVKYKHLFLGILWALLVPLSLGFIFLIVFSWVLRIQTPECPFFLFLIIALFPWNFFSISVAESTMSILENGELIKKANFPRELIPFSIVFANGFNFVCAFFVTLVFLLLFKIHLSPFLLLFPILIVFHIIFNLGFALIVSTLQVRFRDIKYLVEIGLALLFYVTPIFYPLQLISSISERLFTVYMLNPLTVLITLYRSVLIPGYAAHLPSFFSVFTLAVFMASFSFIVFYVGLSLFKSHSNTFADYI